METCCGYRYDLPRKSSCPSRIFKGRQRCTGHRVERDALRTLTPISPAKPIPWDTCPNKEEITLPGTAADVSERACVAAPVAACATTISVSRFGNINPIPFRLTRATHQMTSPRFRTLLSYHLGSTDPCSTAVHMEPFSTHQSSRFSLEYLLLPPRSAPVATPPGLTATASTFTTAPSYSPQSACSALHYCDGPV